MTTPEFELADEFASPMREDWLRLVDKVLQGADFDKRLIGRTADGIRIEPLYTHGHAAPDADPLAREAALQGRGPGWEIRQPCVEDDAAAANIAIREDLAGGADGIALRIEAPGQAGLALGALTVALDDIPLERISVALSAGEAAIDAAQVIAGLWQSRGTPQALRRAAFNLDPIGDLARLGGAGTPLPVALEQAARFAAEPHWRDGGVTVLCADGRPTHEAGGSEAQELACLIATCVSYLRSLEVAGVAPVDALPRIAFALSTDADLFLSIAKLRAARKVIGRLAEAAGAGSAVAGIRIAVTTSERMMTRRDPWVNMLRTCAAGMAAALAGAEAITILPFSWALGRPDAFARRIARNTHIVLSEESSLGRVADPAGGAWYLESLTEALARAAWVEFQAIEAAGGMAAALRSGFVQDRIAAVAADRARLIAAGRMGLTGVSTFPRLGPDGIETKPHAAARTAVGAAETITPLSPIRLAAPFEALRDQADVAIQRSGGAPRVFLASLGAMADHTTRSTWIANFLAAGGIEAIASEGYTSSAEAGRAFADSGATVACLCASDQAYSELGEATALLLKQAGARFVYVAGRPNTEAELQAAGVDGFLFAGQDSVVALKKLQDQLESRPS